MKSATPFVKWAGGKRKLLPVYADKYPKRLQNGEIKKYIEGFVGGGAVFFDLIKKYQFEEVILNDVNNILISTYYIIQQNVEVLIDKLEKVQSIYLEKSPEERESYYYEMREKFNNIKNKIEYDSYGENVIDNTRIEASVCFLFLNRTCFNGLYRENKKGGFNVPAGKYKNPQIVDAKNLRDVSEALKNVKLTNIDFEQLSDFVTEDTFVYLDPPYRPLNVTSSFNSYSKGDFDDEEQCRLAKWYHSMSDKGAAMMLSNSNPKNTNPDDTFFEELYNGFKIYEDIEAARAINSKASKRGAVTEILVVNE